MLLLLLHLFNSLFSRTTWVSRYQKGKTSLDLNEATDDAVLEWQWYQITTPTPHHSIFTGQVLFLMPIQQCQSTAGNNCRILSQQISTAHMPFPDEI